MESDLEDKQSETAPPSEAVEMVDGTSSAESQRAEVVEETAAPAPQDSDLTQDTSTNVGDGNEESESSKEPATEQQDVDESLRGTTVDSDISIEQLPEKTTAEEGITDAEESNEASTSKALDEPELEKNESPLATDEDTRDSERDGTRQLENTEFVQLSQEDKQDENSESEGQMEMQAEDPFASDNLQTDQVESMEIDTSEESKNLSSNKGDIWRDSMSPKENLQQAIKDSNSSKPDSTDEITIGEDGGECNSTTDKTDEITIEGDSGESLTEKEVTAEQETAAGGKESEETDAQKSGENSEGERSEKTGPEQASDSTSDSTKVQQEQTTSEESGNKETGEVTLNESEDKSSAETSKDGKETSSSKDDEKSSKGDGTSDVAEGQPDVLSGQDDELCIIPDSMKVITSSTPSQTPLDANDTEKTSEKSNDVVDLEKETTESQTKEADSQEVCKQCDKKVHCTIVVKSGADTFYVCSEECKTEFAAKNNKAMDIPSDGVNSKRDKRCANCLLIVEANEEKNLSWETMEFCNEECLGKFQTKYGSYCRNCNGSVQAVSLGKYSVRFGYDVRQFCCSTCLEEFKKGLKACSYCQKDISSGSDGFLAPVGDKGQFKDFCTQDCMEKYSRMTGTEPPVSESKVCSVCQEQKIVHCEVKINNTAPVAICSDPCFAAFKFVNKVEPDQCSTCKVFFELIYKKSFVVFYEKEAHCFCSKTCLNVFIITNRKIVACHWCKVKKYNFDMIKKELRTGQVMMMCSLNCLTLYQVSINAVSAKRINCDFCKEFSQAQYHLTMSDATIRNFCSYNCVMNFQGQYTKSPITIPTSDDPVPTGAIQRSVQPVRQTIPQLIQKMPEGQAKKTTPVISSVTSLAMSNGQASPPTSQTAIVKDLASLGVTSQGTQMVYKQQVITRPPSPVKIHNKSTQCKPVCHTKGVMVRPKPCTKETQTDDDRSNQVIMPIPAPVYVPFPMHMYSMPYPVPVPIPIPIPVPIFIPTSRNTTKGIAKEVKRILEKTPSDPFEAELLMMAEMVATEKKTDSDSDSVDDTSQEPPEIPETNNAFGEDMLQMALKMATGEIMDEPAVDLEAALVPSTISAPPLTQESEASQDIESNNVPSSAASNRGKKRTVPYKPRAISKRGRKVSSLNDLPMIAANAGELPAHARITDPADKPDANMALKYTFGVNAWRQWVNIKNAELEKQNTESKKVKLFKTDILQLTADELNYSLCLFVKEVRKPNGTEYAPDTIYYLCLGIQQYLFENNRIDNIFTDSYYWKFTDCLNEVAKKFCSIYNEAQYIVTRVEEEHLWECKQLGAHSPHVLLSTLMFFNTKHFNLVNVDEHMQLSFSHIMKHWKRNPGAAQPLPGKVPGTRNVLLRFYPPQSALDSNSKKKKVYEQQENEDNPLRCPVKLYEFYLSKCPESVKTRNDVFYLLPERSCVPDSPVWYSTTPLDKEQLTKMLNRIKMVKEVNIALLGS